MNNNRIILHIGCGKTGSSALQNWLYRIAPKLLLKNIHYPSVLPISSDPYEITSGNGIPFYRAIKSGSARKYLNDIIDSSDRCILFSSELFQELTDADLADVNNIAESYGFTVKIIVYMRDVYDMVYSSYLQLIKRHSCTNTFSDWATSLKYENIQQFNVLDKYERNFSEIEVIHYDSHRVNGLDKPFCKAIGVTLDDSLMMSKVKVNRSLTLLESSLVRICNEKYRSINKNYSDVFCQNISDALIKSNPELTTELYFNQNIFRHLSQICSSALDSINQKHLKNTPLLVFNAEGKDVVWELPVVHETHVMLINALISNGGYLTTKTTPEEKPNGPPRQLISQGRLEGVTGRSVIGWARLLNTNTPTVVEILVNDVKVGEVTADRYRADLSKTFNLKCAFEFQLNEELSVYDGDLVRARCTLDSTDLIGSPLKFTI